MSIAISLRCRKYLTFFNVKPKAVFENLNNKNSKVNVGRILKNIEGVYAIINLVNGNIYVGSAITSRIPIRFYKHLYFIQGSKLVKAAIQKYNLSNFAFVVLDTVPNTTDYYSNKRVLEIENYYIKLLEPKYNIATQASNTFAVKHTETSKLKIRAKYSSERREQIGNLNRNKKLSSHTIERIRIAALARPPISQNTREKFSINSKVANLYQVTRLDNNILSNKQYSIILRTISKVA